MKVRMAVQMSGSRSDGRDWPPFGAEFEVGESEGRDLCAGGLAVPVAVPRKVETAAPKDVKVEERAEPEPFLPPADEVPAVEEEPVKRGPGRPPGSANKPKIA